MLFAGASSLRANPVAIDPTSLIAFGIVVLAAFVVESGLVALTCTLSGVAPVRIFLAYFVTNSIVYVAFFYPILQKEWVPLIVLELVVVAIDACAVKMLVRFDALQGFGFTEVSWKRALVASAIGNAASYFTGLIARQEPWIQH